MSHLLLQIDPTVKDTVAESHVQALTDSVKAQVDSTINVLTNPDSLATLTPGKVVENIKSFDWTGVVTSLSSQAVSLVLRILAAILIFYIGRFIINKIYKLVHAVMIRKDVDRSLTTFLLSFIKITLLFLLIITVIGVVGIETSSFIAIFASAGVAIGLALSGTLQNFAGGVLILLIKPYKIGDYIEFGNYKGFVKEIQIFHTIITTYNNQRIIIPNGGLSTGTINNYSAESQRRVEWRVSISYGDDVAAARDAILAIMEADERIFTSSTIDEDERLEDEAEAKRLADEAAASEAAKKRAPWWKRLHLWHRRRKAQREEEHQQLVRARLPKKDFTPSVSVEDLADSAVVLVVRAWCKESDYWGVFYSVNERIYTELPKHGLHFPFPQLDVHVDSPGHADA